MISKAYDDLINLIDRKFALKETSPHHQQATASAPVDVKKLNDTEPKEEPRWQFLDGYRGSLALIVAITHSRLNLDCEIINLTISYSQTYSIAGFFMLSSFLLTYRLLNDFAKASTASLLILISIKYAIRRFFRIYIYYVLFYTTAKYGPSWLTKHLQLDLGNGLNHLSFIPSVYEIATLQNAGKNQLWTIAPEIKYYFCIPLFCLIARLLNKYALLLSIASLTWTIYDNQFNFFDLSTNDIMFRQPKSHYLTVHFAVFILGSQVALAVYLAESNATIVRIFKHAYVRTALDYASLLIALVGLDRNLDAKLTDFAFRSRATLYWSSALFLTLLSHPSNMISRFFEASRFLRNVGKYSYSFYIWHCGVASVVATFHIQCQFKHIIVCIGVTYFVSFLGFYVIENPLIKITNWCCAKVDGFRREQNWKIVNH